jgi:hypothetical protein
MDGSRGAHRAMEAHSLICSLGEFERGALRGEWRHWMREAWAPTFMEGSWRLDPHYLW